MGFPNLFGNKKAAPKSSSAPSKPAAKSASKESTKNMTWGGRPDPTPELYVDPNAAAVLPGWKLNLFGKKK